MPRPSELLRIMVKELAAGGRQDALRELGRWLDQLNAQMEPTTLRIEGGGGGASGAPTNAPYLTVGAASGLTAYRQIAHDATLTHNDTGALGAYTLGVVANGHRHIEENIDETHYLVVDAGGLGDFTTVQAAITYLETINSGQWTVLIRNGTYTEHVATSLGGYGLTLIGLGDVTIQDDDATLLFGNTSNNSVPSPLEMRNITLLQTSGVTTTHNPVLGIGNGANVILRHCTLTPYGVGGVFAGNGGLTAYHCSFGSSANTYTSGVLRSPGVSGAVIALYNCLIHGWTQGAAGIVNPSPGNDVRLIGCRILNYYGGQHITVTGGLVSVGRCLYDRTKTAGTISIYDGDVPNGNRSVVAVKAADYTLTTTDEVVVFTATATAALPAATGTGQTYRLVCRAGTLTIDAGGSDTIKGDPSQTLYAGEDLIITDTAAGLWE